MKKIIVLVSLLAVFGGGWWAISWMEQPSQGIVFSVDPDELSPVPTPTPLRYQGKTFTVELPSDYRVSEEGPLDDVTLDRTILISNTLPTRKIAIGVVITPATSLEEVGGVSFRRQRAGDYSTEERFLAGTAGLVFRHEDDHGREITGFWLVGGKLITIGVTGRVSLKTLDRDLTQVLASFNLSG